MKNDRTLTDQLVIVRGSSIAGFFPEGVATVPRGSREVDGRGLFLMPGLVDAHTHPGGASELVSFLRYGQTTIYTLNGEGIALRRSRNVFRPNILSSTTTIDGPGYILNPRFHVFRRPGDAAPVLDFEQRRGANFIKIYGQIPEDSLAALDREGGRRKLVVVGHLPRAYPLERSLPHMRVVAHAEEFLHILPPESSQSDLEHSAKVAAANNVSVMTTLVTMTGQPRHMRHLKEELEDPEQRYLSDETYQQWLPANDRYATMSPDEQLGFSKEVELLFPKLQSLTRLLHQFGVPLIAGSDSPTFCYPGKCLLEELNLLHKSGLSNFEVLRTATVNAGRFAFLVAPNGGKAGTVERGARADFILIGANPLSSLDALHDIRGVMVSGRWIDRSAIDTERDRIARKLARSHARVDRFEQLLKEKKFNALVRWLATVSHPEVGFNPNVVINDAEALQSSGQRRKAVLLASQFVRRLPLEFAVWNELGKLKASIGERYQACRAYRRSLRLRPLNGTALAGLAQLRSTASKCH